MKFEISLYEIKGLLKPRRGALLKVQFDDELIGYADCHPWESLGDYSLTDQIHLLSRGRLSRLTNRSLWFARQDAKARSSKHSLFEGLTIPKSHYLIVNLQNWNESQYHDAREKGFSIFKIKMGKALVNETKLLMKFFNETSSDALVRLDFNRSLNGKKWKEFLKEIFFYLHRIDFIEDPFPISDTLWKKDHGVMFARDYNSEVVSRFDPYIKCLVLKPGIIDCQRYAQKRYPQNVSVTSLIDHPVGQLGAAFVSAHLNSFQHVKLVPCGITTHLVYDKDPFIEQLSIKEGVLIPPSGTGIGFDDLLPKLDWKKI